MNFRFSAIACCLVAALLQTGCVTKPPVKTYTLKKTFDEDEAKNALRKGDSTITGSALLRQAGGGVVTCAGLEVGLVPATEYAVERIRALYGSSIGGFRPITPGDLVFEPPEPISYKQLTRTTACDAQGYFKFQNLAPGRYYVGTSITWVVPTGPYSSNHEGGSLSRQVTVEPASTVDMVLTR